MGRAVFKIVLLLGLLLSTPSHAKVANGGTVELFLQCSELHRRSASLKAELKDLTRQAKPGMAKDRRLVSEVRRHQKEARRLEKIADIMRSSDEVQSKYRRAVRRYKQAYSRYKEHRKFVDRMSRLYDRRSDARKSIARRTKSECNGNWKNSILQRFCAGNRAKHKHFCSKFSKFKPAPIKQKKKRKASTPPRGKFGSWRYAGIEGRGTSSPALIAQTKIGDDTLKLIYKPATNALTLLFIYRGRASFSRTRAKEAKFFMRTRKEPRLKGRYDSDYVFTGSTKARPRANPGEPQYVVARLSGRDISALRKYERNKIIGVRYFTTKSGWKTYTLPASGVWAAYRHLKAKAPQK